MQTLAKYLFGLLLFFFASLTNEEPVKEETVERCSQKKVETAYVCSSEDNLEAYI